MSGQSGDERPKDDGFYVGYLQMPPLLAWIVRGLILVVVVLAAADAVLVSQLQQASGDGRWGDSPQVVTGMLVMEPYPMLLVPGENGPVPHLIVNDTKRGAATVLGGLTRGGIDVTGQLIERPGMPGIKMIEAADGAAKANLKVAAAALPQAESLGERTLNGEILDSKCWLGVMRPGAGPVHKGCAQLCILGGIPPMFLTRGPDGRETGYLLTDAEGRAIAPDRIARQVGLPVRLSGAVERRGPMLVFKADIGGLEVLK